MAVTATKYPLTIQSGDVAETDWIDISSFQRVRLVVPELPSDEEGLKPQYEVSIIASTTNPALPTPPVNHGSKYMCGITMYDEYVAQSDIFDRKVELGANHIKIQLRNRRNAPSIDAFLITEN
jgi:hypothetical protein